MKRAVLVLMALLLLTTTCWAQAPKGQDVTMTGMISCTFCNLPGGGKCTKECCQSCVKAGDPVLFTDAKGSLYILLSGEQMKPLIGLGHERILWAFQKPRMLLNLAAFLHLSSKKP